MARRQFSPEPLSSHTGIRRLFFLSKTSNGVLTSPDALLCEISPMGVANTGTNFEQAPSVDREATVDDQRFARDERGLVASEKEHGVGHLDGFGDALQGEFLGKLRL